MTSAAHPQINCWICDKPIALETAKTDENGRTVHEECYVLREALNHALNQRAHLEVRWALIL